MKVCQNFIKSYVPGKHLLADALSCPPGRLHLDCNVPAKLGMCSPLGKIRCPLLWEEQNCSEEKKILCRSSLWLHQNVGVEKEMERVRHVAVSGKGVGFFSDAEKSGRKDPREGTARQKLRRKKCERKTGQENL